ncbi:hypothetical protein RB601_000701 [Gaeumannomyces tritici]
MQRWILVSMADMRVVNLQLQPQLRRMGPRHRLLFSSVSALIMRRSEAILDGGLPPSAMMANWQDHQQQQQQQPTPALQCPPVEPAYYEGHTAAGHYDTGPEVAYSTGNHLYPVPPSAGSSAPMLQDEHQITNSLGAFTPPPPKHSPVTPTTPTPLASGVGASGAVSDNAPRQRLLLVGVAILVALVAAAVGGVVGWKVTESTKSPSTCAPASGAGNGGDGREADPKRPPPPLCPTTGMTANGSSKYIRGNSAIAVAGCRSGDDFFVKLAYQAPDDSIMVSELAAPYGSWDAPRPIVRASAEKMMAGGPLTATVIYVEDQPYYMPQYQFYYLSDTGKVLGVNFRNHYPGGLTDSVNTQPFMASTRSSMSALWPYVHFKAPDGKFYEVGWSNMARPFPNITATDVAEDSPLLALPLKVDQGASPLRDPSVRLFYRGAQDGRLNVHARGGDNGVLREQSGPLGVEIPQGSPLAGFATARQGGGVALDTVVLFQDAGGRILFVSQTAAVGGGGGGGSSNNNNKWSDPKSDPVFSGADVPTRIACLTQGTGVNDGGSQRAMKLSAREDMNMCFFQADGGKLRYVLYQGGQWRNLGYIPMP